MSEPINHRVKHFFLATYWAFIDILPFALAIALVSITYGWFGVSWQELWVLPEWWIATIFMLIEGMRDAVRKPHPIYGELDVTAVVTILVTALLPASALLILLIAHSKTPGIKIPGWFGTVQAIFLAYASLVFLITKGRSKFFELEAALREYQRGEVKM